MSTEENREVVRRAFDSMSAGPDAFVAEHDEIYSADLVGHFSGMPPVDINMHRQFGLGTFSAFPDLKRPVQDLVAEGGRRRQAGGGLSAAGRQEDPVGDDLLAARKGGDQPPVGRPGPAMRHRRRSIERKPNEIVRRGTAEVRQETNAAGVVLFE